MKHQSERAWRFGCQARPWLQTLGQDEFTRQLPKVMRQIASVGFEGFETALACLPLDDPASFAAWRAGANGIELVAAHTGGAWWEPDTAASVPDLLEQVSRLPDLGCHRLMVSIGRGVIGIDDQALEKMMVTLRTLGMGAAQYGVDIAIHNHDHELADDARVLRAIVGGTSGGEIRLGADLGWVAHGGWDPAVFIDTFGDRLSYLHVRDVREIDGRARFVEVGSGDMDWPAIRAALGRVSYTGWLVAESEFTDTWIGFSDPMQTAEAQVAGMRERLRPA
ncbi:MAG: sugar phosphate isomerase/epimerase [Chloroflexia bacterium]|nr:sugar phosphate isomerase/epimerase [Chloroflexia bacterium]